MIMTEYDSDISLNTVPGLFYSQVRRSGNRIAMRKKILGIWHEITWNEYYDKVKNLSMGLLKLGIKKGDCVSILSENNPEWVYSDIAAQCIGGITAGIYTTSSPEETAYVLNHSESTIIFVENDEQLDKVLSIDEDLPFLKKIIVYDMKGLRDFSNPLVISFNDFMKLCKDELEKDPQLFENLWPRVQPNDTAIIVYTSGTTGLPKGAMLSHENITWTIKKLGEINTIYDSDEVLSFLPLCHIAERCNTVFNALTYGLTVNFAESLNTVPENLREISPQIFFTVPRFWEKFYSGIILLINEATWLEKKLFNRALETGEKISLLKQENKQINLYLRIKYAIAGLTVFRNLKNMLGLDRGRYIVSGAAPISPDILKFFQAAGIPIMEAYGQTETSGIISVHSGNDTRLGTVGKPLPGTEVKIAEDGEILVKGPNVFQGYLKNPELTKEILKDEWLHTGDIGRFDEYGNLIISDRKKDIIITSGGKNITPQYIENKLKFSPYINDAVIIGDGKKYLTCLIMIDHENVMQYAQDCRIPFTTYKSLCHSEGIIELIQNEVNKVNKTLARVETIKKFRLIDIELTSDDPELTATMKLKRSYVNERFKDLIYDMY